MAINAGGRVAVSAGNRLGVKTFLVCGLLIAVAGRTAYLLRSALVRGALDISMAVDAGEHAAMDRILECLGIDVKADRLAIHFVRQGSVTMACETLLSGWFYWFLTLGITGAQPKKQEEDHFRDKKISCCSRGHTAHPPICSESNDFSVPRPSGFLLSYFLPRLRT